MALQEDVLTVVASVIERYPYLTVPQISTWIEHATGESLTSGATKKYVDRAVADAKKDSRSGTKVWGHDHSMVEYFIFIETECVEGEKKFQQNVLKRIKQKTNRPPASLKKSLDKILLSSSESRLLFGGDYDLLLKVYCSTPVALADYVANLVRPVKGVVRTQTVFAHA